MKTLKPNASNAIVWSFQLDSDSLNNGRNYAYASDCRPSKQPGHLLRDYVKIENRVSSSM